MKKIKEYKGIIIIVLILILGAFYWFQLRPNQIRKECMKMAQQGITSNSKETEESFQVGSFVDKYQAKQGLLSGEKINELYLICLRAKGLEN